MAQGNPLKRPPWVLGALLIACVLVFLIGGPSAALITASTGAGVLLGQVLPRYVGYLSPAKLVEGVIGMGLILAALGLVVFVFYRAEWVYVVCSVLFFPFLLAFSAVFLVRVLSKYANLK